MKRPQFLKSRKRRSAEKRAKVIKEAKDRGRKVRSNGHTPPWDNPEQEPGWFE